jgi:hypothetical protein
MRHFARTSVLATVALVAATGCHKKKQADAPQLPTVSGSGVGSFESRSLPPFTRLTVGGGLEVTVNVGKNAPLELRGDDNLFRHVPSTVVDGELTLKPDAAFDTTQPFRLVLGSERLDALATAVGAKVTLHGVKADQFSVRAGGASRVTADGSATTLTVAARSIAQLDFSAFSAGNASVTVADLARVRLGYLEKLDATQTGRGVITYGGTPDVVRHVERAANVAPASP